MKLRSSFSPLKAVGSLFALRSVFKDLHRIANSMELLAAVEQARYQLEVNAVHSAPGALRVFDRPGDKTKQPEPTLFMQTEEDYARIYAREEAIRADRPDISEEELDELVAEGEE
jgi:hypothetical protein